MYRALTFLATAFASVSICAASPQAPQPAATQPSSSPAAHSAVVLVLPMEAPAGNFAWVARAVQQDMLVDLTQLTRARILAPSGSSAADSDAAVRAGRNAGADFVVFGAVQNSGSQLRVTGQLLDAATGNTLANLKATAPADNLFPLEDALSMQVARGLPTALAAADLSARLAQPAVVNARSYISDATPAPQYESIPAPGPDYYTTVPSYSVPYSYADPDYGYPVYGGFGWWGPGVVIIGPHHGGDHFGHGHLPFGSPRPGIGFGGHGFAGGGFGGSRGFGGHGGGGMHGR